MSVTRPFVLLALAVLLAPRAEASRGSAWESNPPALTSLNEHSEPATARAFDLGDVALASVESDRESAFHLGPITLLGADSHPSLSSSYPKTRVWAIDFLGSTLVTRSTELSLESRWACGDLSCGIASDEREDPLGLEASVSQSGWFVISNPKKGGKIQRVAPEWARSNPAALKGILIDEGALSEEDALSLMAGAGISAPRTAAPCRAGDTCIGPGPGVRSPEVDVAMQAAGVAVCGANNLNNAVDAVTGQGRPIPCPIGPPRTEAGETFNRAAALLTVVGGVGARSPGRVAPETGELRPYRPVGEVKPPDVEFGTVRFGNQIHQTIGDWLAERFPNTQFELRLKPGQTGVDVVYRGGRYPGFRHAEIKPRTSAGMRKFLSQAEKWELSPDDAIAITYDAEGRIYVGW